MATYKIEGMDCAEEVAVLKREFSPHVQNVEKIAFDVLNGTMTIDLTNELTDDMVRASVAKTGMKARPWSADKQENAGISLRRGRTLATAVSGVTLVGTMVVQGLQHDTIRAVLDALGGSGEYGISRAAVLCASISIITGSWYVIPKAMNAARHLRPDMNLLMITAVIGATIIGQVIEAATVSFLFAVSLALESWSVGRARRAVEKLLDLAPDLVHLKESDGREHDVSPDYVTVGSVFVVKPGERFPLDGIVSIGSGSANQSPITGESKPIAKGPGDTVFAGTINGEAALLVTSTKPASDTTLAHIIDLVGSASAKRAHVEQWVERFARIYTPSILILAILVGVVPPIFFGGDWSQWTYQALVLLVIGCPCALVISTPVSIVAGLAAAAHQGILIKGGTALEIPAGLRAIALDKTGTLTTGKPSVRQITPLSGHNENVLLAIASSLELRSTHPLAQAIVKHAADRGVNPAPADRVEAIAGKGVSGVVAGTKHWLGSHRFLEERQQETAQVHQRLELLEASGDSVVVIGNADHVCGYISLADTIRTESHKAVAALHKLGIEHIVMLTGDNRGTAEAIRQSTGVDQVQAELLPQEKVAAIESLVSQYGRVAMVGDGINDAPALARATLGIAMGAGGSDAAIETADIALMSDDLGKLPWLIHHSRKTLSVIRQNISLALAIKAVFVILTLAGHASLWAAIAADMGASLLVTFNGLRLLRSGQRSYD